MKKSREFDIAWVGLSLGIHTFSYEITDSFFENFATTEFTNAKLQVKLTLDKKSNIFLLKFDVDGTVDVVCDRCSDTFALRIWDEFHLVVKLTDKEEVESADEQDDEIVHFARTESLMNVSEWLYDFIVLSIPIQKLHPTDNNGKSTCNAKALEILEKYSIKTEEKPTNPIWEGLQKIKTKKDAKS